MKCVSINIQPHLAEYMRGKYNNGLDSSVKIPDKTDLYHLIWSLMSIKRCDQPILTGGNLLIQLPHKRIGKDPLYYNYLSPRAVSIIETEIRRMFNREVHVVMEDNEQEGRKLYNRDVAYSFLASYGIESITDDALLKSFYRYRESIRRKKRRRKYVKNT